jgi:hypothetical protein
MKYLALLISLIAFTSCARRSIPHITAVSIPPPTIEPTEAVRFSEIVRAYHLGRYVDPNQPDVMHESHPVLRVETRSRWNLKPGGRTSDEVLLNPPRDPAFWPPSTNDLVLAELNRQREVTQGVIAEAAQLAKSYAEFQQVIKDMAVVATNHAWMEEQIQKTQRRLLELENEVRKALSEPAASVTNETHSSSPTPGDPPKP